MIKSMTAYARHSTVIAEGEISWELRSVNHRYFDATLRLDKLFYPIEIPLRKQLADKLARGKVELTIKFQPNVDHQQGSDIDEKQAEQLLQQCQWITDHSQQVVPIDPVRFLQWPGILTKPEVDADMIRQTALDGLGQVIEQLIEGRQTEGVTLAKLIQQRCQEINVIADNYRKELPYYLAQHQQRIEKKLHELNVQIDPNRLEQELVLFLQKSDVAEELDRLESHIKAVEQALQREEPVGRRLDFLMQELNREANTLGSKSISISGTNDSVQLKVLIEQMREQIQNIE